MAAPRLYFFATKFPAPGWRDFPRTKAYPLRNTLFCSYWLL